MMTAPGRARNLLRWAHAQIQAFGWHGVAAVVALAFLWRGFSGVYRGAGDIVVGLLVLTFVLRSAWR